MADITPLNCKSEIAKLLYSVPCPWQGEIARAICTAINSVAFSGYSGYSGFSGEAGISGFSGLDGQAASSGLSGYSGYSGAGFSGFSGYSGFSGSAGASGFSGANPGSSGFSGFSGSNPGSSGFSGFSGDNPGSSGFSGLSGYSGFSGFSGASGYSGFSGISTSGFSGFSGAAGTSGFSGDSSLITADNGLSKNIPTNIQLGGPVGLPAPLLHDSYVLNDGFTMVFQGNQIPAILQGLNGSGGVGVVGTSVSGNGVQGISTSSNGMAGSSTSGTGVRASSSSGIGLFAISTNSIGADININPTSSSTVAEIARFERTTQNTASDGIGGSLTIFVEDDSGNSRSSNKIVSTWVTAATATRMSQMDILGVNASSDNTIMSVYGTGVVGIGISSAYTASRLNVVDNALAGGGLKMVNLTSTSTNNSTLLNVSGTGSMAGIVSTTSGQVAITGTSSTATAISGTSTSGFGVAGSSNTSLAGIYTVNPASTNTVVPIALYQRGTTGTAANNIGGSIQIAVNCVTNGGRIGTELVTKWLDATDATRTSEFSITGVDSSTTKTLLQITGPGIFTITQGLSNFADDAAAAAGGIPVNGLYRTASAVKIRVS